MAETEQVTIAFGKHRTAMGSLSHKLLVALLTHQREHRLSGETYQPGKIDLRLLSVARLGHLAHAGGRQPLAVPAAMNAIAGALDEVHRWCAANHWPPLDALVVDASTRRPGPRYPDNHHWERDVYAALLFEYPAAAASIAT